MGRLATPCGTPCPAATWRAPSRCAVRRIVEEDVGAEGFEERPLRARRGNSASSRRTPHSRRGAITRSCAGAERAVTSAVRIGEASLAGTPPAGRATRTGNRGTGPPDMRVFRAFVRGGAERPTPARARPVRCRRRSRVAIEGDALDGAAQLAEAEGRMVAAATPAPARRPDSGIGGQEQLRAERRCKGQTGAPAVNGGATDVQPVVLDGD